MAINHEEKPLPLALVCLVDWRQTGFTLRGEAGRVFRVTLPPGPEERLELVLPPRDDGEHEVAFLLFLLPDLHREDADFRRDSRFFIHSYRARIAWGEGGGEPGVRFEAVGAPDAEARQGIRTFSLDPSPEAREPWTRGRSSDGRFFVTLRSPREDKLSAGLLAFLDWEQVPFSPGETVRWIEMEPGSRAVVAGVLPGVPEGGKGEFLVLLAEGPFMLSGARGPRLVRSTQRVLLGR